jgi:hypothetical protein
MQVCHGVSARFDDPNLVSCAGLAPVMALARRCGLAGLVAERLTLTGDRGANPAVKVACLVAGMVAGADSIDDMDLLRHGAMGRLFGGVRAPSTLGTFLPGGQLRARPPARQRRGGGVAEPGGAHAGIARRGPDRLDRR